LRKQKVVGIDANALDMLKGFNWPGNIRQLETLSFARSCCATATACTSTISRQIATQLGIEVRAAFDLDDEPLPGEMPSRPFMPFAAAAPAALEPGAATARNAGISVMGIDGHLRKLEEIEHELIRFRHRQIRRSHVGSGAPSRHRALHALSQTARNGPRRNRRLRGPTPRCSGVTPAPAFAVFRCNDANLQRHFYHFR